MNEYIIYKKYSNIPSTPLDLSKLLKNDSLLKNNLSLLIK